MPCSFCRKLGRNITTCKIALKENVNESEALVESLSTAAHIAQCSPVLDRTDNEGKALAESLLTATLIAQGKLAKDQKRFAEVERAGKGVDDPEEWVRIDVEKLRSKLRMYQVSPPAVPLMTTLQTTLNICHMLVVRTLQSQRRFIKHRQA